MFKFKKIIFIWILLGCRLLNAFSESWVQDVTKLFSGFKSGLVREQKQIDGIIDTLVTYEIRSSDEIESYVLSFAAGLFPEEDGSDHQAFKVDRILHKGENGGVFRVTSLTSREPNTLIVKLFDLDRSFLKEVSVLAQLHKLELDRFKIAKIMGAAKCIVSGTQVYMLAQEDLGSILLKDVLSQAIETHDQNSAEYLQSIMVKLASALAQFHYKNVENTLVILDEDLKKALQFELNNFQNFVSSQNFEFNLIELKSVAEELIDYASRFPIIRGRMHLDLHFKNLVITRDNEIGLIDFAGSFYSMRDDGFVIGIPGFDISYFTHFHAGLRDFRLSYLQKTKEQKWLEQQEVIDGLAIFLKQYHESCLEFGLDFQPSVKEDLFYQMVQGVLLFVYKYNDEAAKKILTPNQCDEEHKKTASLLAYCLNHLQNVVNKYKAMSGQISAVH